MKIERLAGIPGEPVVEKMLYGEDRFVVQYDVNNPENGMIYGPDRSDEQSAIRAWNAMVRRVREANAQEVKR